MKGEKSVGAGALISPLLLRRKKTGWGFRHFFKRNVYRSITSLVSGVSCLLDVFALFVHAQAFFEGKLKIAGNTALALKLQTIMPKPQSKL